MKVRKQCKTYYNDVSGFLRKKFASKALEREGKTNKLWKRIFQNRETSQEKVPKMGKAKVQSLLFYLNF